MIPYYFKTLTIFEGRGRRAISATVFPYKTATKKWRAMITTNQPLAVAFSCKKRAAPESQDAV